MSGSDEEFNLTTQFEEPLNSFKIVHLYNKSDTYHLTRQVLLDSALTQNTYCFFYHILGKPIKDFNTSYGSFSFLISRNTHENIEAELYLNVDSKALAHIVKYIQTGKINIHEIYIEDRKNIDEIMDLASMFGMPKLVNMLRGINPTSTEIDETSDFVKYFATSLILACKTYVPINGEKNKQLDILKDFVSSSCSNNTFD